MAVAALDHTRKAGALGRALTLSPNPIREMFCTLWRKAPNMAVFRSQMKTHLLALGAFRTSFLSPMGWTIPLLLSRSDSFPLTGGGACGVSGSGDTTPPLSSPAPRGYPGRRVFGSFKPGAALRIRIGARSGRGLGFSLGACLPVQIRRPVAGGGTGWSWSSFVADSRRRYKGFKELRRTGQRMYELASACRDSSRTKTSHRRTGEPFRRRVRIP